MISRIFEKKIFAKQDRKERQNWIRNYVINEKNFCMKNLRICFALSSFLEVRDYCLA